MRGILEVRVNRLYSRAIYHHCLTSPLIAVCWSFVAFEVKGDSRVQQWAMTFRSFREEAEISANSYCSMISLLTKSSASEEAKRNSFCSYIKENLRFRVQCCSVRNISCLKASTLSRKKLQLASLFINMSQYPCSEIALNLT